MPGEYPAQPPKLRRRLIQAGLYQSPSMWAKERERGERTILREVSGPISNAADAVEAVVRIRRHAASDLYRSTNFATLRLD